MIKNLTNYKIINAILAVATSVIFASCTDETVMPVLPEVASASGDAVTISNPGFENGWNGWNDEDPSSISGDSNSGSSSAKITGSGGSFEQNVSVKANTEYTLSAYVLGSWRIGVNVGGNRVTRSGNSSSWKKESVTFSTGSSTTATILGEYNSGEGRFDDFELIEGEGATTGGSTQRHQEMVGKIVRIENVTSDLWVRIDASSTGAPVELTGQSSTGTWPRWQVEEVLVSGNYYYRFRNVASNRRFRTTGTGTRDIEMGSTSNTGEWTQWEVSSDGNGNYNFKNRAHGTYLHANANSSTSHVQTRNSLSGNLTTWRIEDLSGDDANSESGGPTGNLDPNKAPSENFDLSKWKLTLTSAAEINTENLNNGYELNNQFYTNTSDGGMVFKNYPAGPDAGTTSNSTQYSRVEFREMLRGTEDWWEANMQNSFGSYPSTQGINKNNWVFSSSSSSNESKAGGVDGTMTATLAVNRVTQTSSKDIKLGRVVVGQIHASENEPCRLYYHKQPSHSKGAIYFGYEPNSGSEVFYTILGSNYVNSGGDYKGAGNPSDGIGLNEKWGYEIKVVGNLLTVTIYDENGNFLGDEDVNMSSGDLANDWMYFKAGLYSQNDEATSSTDYEQVTFYSLDVSHN